MSREDIISVGYDAEAVYDKDLDRIAEGMHEDHTEYGGYRVSLKDACEDMGIPKLPKFPKEVIP